MYLSTIIIKNGFSKPGVWSNVGQYGSDLNGSEFSSTFAAKLDERMNRGGPSLSWHTTTKWRNLEIMEGRSTQMVLSHQRDACASLQNLVQHLQAITWAPLYALLMENNWTQSLIERSAPQKFLSQSLEQMNKNAVLRIAVMRQRHFFMH